jgi:hypothetical protein
LQEIYHNIKNDSEVNNNNSEISKINTNLGVNYTSRLFTSSKVHQFKSFPDEPRNAAEGTSVPLVFSLYIVYSIYVVNYNFLFKISSFF